MPLFYQTEEVTSHQACQVFSHCWPGWAGWLQRWGPPQCQEPCPPTHPRRRLKKEKMSILKKAWCQFWIWPAPLEEEEPEEANSPNVDAATWRKTNEKKSNYFSHDNICHQWEEEHFLQEEKRKRGCVLTWGKAASPGKRLPTSFVTLGTTFWTFLYFLKSSKQVWHLNISSHRCIT